MGGHGQSESAVSTQEVGPGHQEMQEMRIADLPLNHDQETNGMTRTTMHTHDQQAAAATRKLEDTETVHDELSFPRFGGHLT
jgi:hypothetical protein